MRINLYSTKVWLSGAPAFTQHDRLHLSCSLWVTLGPMQPQAVYRSLLKLISVESAMLSNRLILWFLLFFLPSIFPSIRAFSNESALHIRWPKYWSFGFSISPSNKYWFPLEWNRSRCFFWDSLAFSIIQWMLAVWSLVPLPFLNPAFTSESSQFTHCQSLAWKILSLTLLAWVLVYGSLNILWHCPFLGVKWKLSFSSPVATAEFSKFADTLSAAL